jgi:hypothetical protein
MPVPLGLKVCPNGIFIRPEAISGCHPSLHIKVAKFVKNENNQRDKERRSPIFYVE